MTERRNIPEVLVTSTAGISQINTPSIPSVPVETEPAEPETTFSRMYLPSGSPPRPTPTATCRPRTWVQHVSEGQIEEHSSEDDNSVKSEPLEPLVLEGLPDELGPEWRVLHPFEILGVRFPTEDTLPNHRRLAESDALVELIQTAFQRTLENNQQDGNWVTSAHVEGRNDIRQESQMPPDPLPSRFLDWSSLGSPHTRASPHSAPDTRVEQNENIQNQLHVQSAVVTRQEMVRTGSPEEVNISPQTDQQVEDQSVPAMGVEPMPLNIEARMPRDDIESNEENNIPTTQTSEGMMPSLNVGELVPRPSVQQESGNNSDTSRGSHVRTQDINVQENLSILPGERLTSSRDRMIISENINIAQHHPCEGTHPQRMSTLSA